MSILSLGKSAKHSSQGGEKKKGTFEKKMITMG